MRKLRVTTISVEALDAVTGGKPDFSYLPYEWDGDERSRRPLRRRSDDFSPFTLQPRWSPGDF